MYWTSTKNGVEKSFDLAFNKAMSFEGSCVDGGNV